MFSALQTILGVVAGLATLVGLGFSVAAWRRAKAAETAAEQARDAVRRGNAAEDLQGLSDKALDLLACVQNEQVEAARLRSRDLLSEVSRARQRWRNYLDDESGERLDKAGRDISRVSRALSAGVAANAPEVRDKLVRYCHEIATALADELGKMLRLIERRER